MGEYHMNPATMLAKIPHLQNIKTFLVAGDLDSAEQEMGHVFDFDFAATVELLSAMRVAIYCAAIEQQSMLQESGIQRVTMLRECFSFYANQVLGGKKEPVIIDLMQQETDIATMFSFSHSFKLQAEKLKSSITAKAFQYACKVVDHQERSYKSFKKGQNEKDLEAEASNGVRHYSPAEIIQMKEQFEFSTLDVANCNMQLSQTNFRLFSNIGLGLYVWLKNHQNAHGNSPLTKSLLPKEDLDYETQLLSLALERVEAYAKRGKLLYDLADKVSDVCGDCELISLPTMTLSRS